MEIDFGFGKGFYDRALKDTKAKRIGICFEEQLVEEIPSDDKDIKMDKVIY